MESLESLLIELSTIEIGSIARNCTSHMISCLRRDREARKSHCRLLFIGLIRHMIIIRKELEGQIDTGRASQEARWGFILTGHCFKWLSYSQGDLMWEITISWNCVWICTDLTGFMLFYFITCLERSSQANCWLHLCFNQQSEFNLVSIVVLYKMEVVDTSTDWYPQLIDTSNWLSSQLIESPEWLRPPTDWDPQLIETPGLQPLKPML